MKPNKFIYLFIAKALVAYLIWFFLYEQWLLKVGWLDNLIIDNLIFLTELLLQLFNFEYFTYGHSIGIDGSHGVYVGIPCNGIDLISLFAGFIIIFNGSWKNKIWYIPLGIIIIHFLNVIRIFALILIENSNPELLEFNHKYTFTILLYIIVFVGWMLWVRKYSTTDK